MGISGTLYYNSAGALPSGARPALKAGIDRHALDNKTLSTLMERAFQLWGSCVFLSSRAGTSGHEVGWRYPQTFIYLP